MTNDIIIIMNNNNNNNNLLTFVLLSQFLGSLGNGVPRVKIIIIIIIQDLYSAMDPKIQRRLKIQKLASENAPCSV